MVTVLLRSLRGRGSRTRRGRAHAIDTTTTDRSPLCSRCLRAGRTCGTRTRRSSAVENGGDGLAARVEGRGHGGDGDGGIGGVAGGKLVVHSGVRVVGRRGVDSLRGGVGRVAIARLEAGAVAVGVLAAIQNGVAAVGPDVEVGDGDVGARHVGRAVHLNGTALGAVRAGALPVGEADVGVADAVTVGDVHAAPGGVEVQRVGVGVASEVVERQVGHGARAAIGLDHVHLVGVVCVDVVVLNIGDVCQRSVQNRCFTGLDWMKLTNTGGQRTHGTAARPVAVDLFNENVGRWVLHSDALVLVGHFNVVDV